MMNKTTTKQFARWILMCFTAVVVGALSVVALHALFGF